MGATDILLRGIHVAALGSLFGTLLFAQWVLPAGGEAAMRKLLQLRVAPLSLAIACLAGFAWLVTESAAMASADNVGGAFHALPLVALRTHFGHWMVLRLGLLILILPLLRRPTIAVAVTGAAFAVQPMLGHAGAVGGSMGAEMIASEVVHVLAAGAWLGGLLPLFLAVGRLPRELAVATCRGFTPVGLAAVLLLAGTAVVQAAILGGGLPGLLGTSYGHAALVKSGLFLGLLALAALNRFVFIDRLARSPDAMRVSIAGEMLLGFAVILSAAVLASRMPGTHEQPVWPLPWRLSGWAFADPDARAGVITALAGTSAGIGAAIAGLAWRRVRWFACAAAAILLALGLPRLDLLLVPAYPTSYLASPTEFAATSIAAGARLFVTQCAACHGAQGHGDSPAAGSLPVRPADLTEHVAMHRDGDLYWFIAHGFTAPDGTTVMPGFAPTLSTDAIWHLVDYLRAHNAGEAMRRTGRWPQPVPMPQFDAACADGRTIDLDDLRGRAFRIVAGNEPVPSEFNAVIVLVNRGTASPTDDVCVAAEPQVWFALAILVGASPDALPGTQVLVDANGWLRAVSRSGESIQIGQARDIIAHPLPVDAAGPTGHHH